MAQISDRVAEEVPAHVTGLVLDYTFCSWESYSDYDSDCSTEASGEAPTPITDEMEFNELSGDCSEIGPEITRLTFVACTGYPRLDDLRNIRHISFELCREYPDYLSEFKLDELHFYDCKNMEGLVLPPAKKVVLCRCVGVPVLQRTQVLDCESMSAFPELTSLNAAVFAGCRNLPELPYGTVRAEYNNCDPPPPLPTTVTQLSSHFTDLEVPWHVTTLIHYPGKPEITIPEHIRWAEIRNYKGEVDAATWRELKERLEIRLHNCSYLQ